MCSTVLVVEDDEDIREPVVAELQHTGYQVFAAANGKEALDLLAKEPLPGVILLDLMMPVLNGWQFLDAVAKDAKLSSIPIVIVSATIDESILPPLIPHLSKPFTFDALLDKVNECCSSSICSATSSSGIDSPS